LLTENEQIAMLEAKPFTFINEAYKKKTAMSLL
jgi:hypothetical protein